MTLSHLPSEFQKALPILRKIKAAGYEAYFVGGSVRDAILGRPIHDVDIASSSLPQETKKLFAKTIDIGIEHGTILVLEGGGEYEITTFRTEENYVDYRRPSSVHFVRSLEEDLKRRDFTINALALDETGQIIDLFEGLDDLQKKQIKAVGDANERFEEDALRVMRAFRFAAALNFDIVKETLSAIEKHVPFLKKISIERSFIEFDKLLLGDFWQKGLGLLLSSKAQNYLPGLENKGPALERELLSLRDDFTFSSSQQAWAYLLICLEVSQVKAFLKKWKTSSHLQKEVEKLVAVYRIRQERALMREDVYHYGKESLLQVESLRQAKGLVTDFRVIEKLDEQLSIHSKQEIVVTGSTLITELGFQPGPQLGQVLKEVENKIVAGELANNKADILSFIKARGQV